MEKDTIPWYNPIAAIKNALRNTFRFSGRATRAEFWWLMAFLALAPGLGYFLLDPLAYLEDLSPWLPVCLVAALGILAIICAISCAVRRLRDSGATPCWLLLPALTSAAYGLHAACSTLLEQDTLLVTLNLTALALVAIVGGITLYLLCQPSK